MVCHIIAIFTFVFVVTFTLNTMLQSNQLYSTFLSFQVLSIKFYVNILVQHLAFLLHAVSKHIKLQKQCGGGVTKHKWIINPFYAFFIDDEHKIISLSPGISQLQIWRLRSTGLPAIHKSPPSPDPQLHTRPERERRDTW